MKPAWWALYASELAAAANMHTSRRAHEVLDAVWRRGSPETFRRAMAAANRRTAEEVVAEAAAASPAVAAALAAAESARPASAVPGAAATLAQSASAAALAAGLPAAAIAEIRKETQKRAYCSHGTRREFDVLLEMQALPKFGALVAGGSFLKREMDEGAWVLGGRVDALDSETVVEIKNRVRCLLGLTIYDKVQLMAYMHLTGLREGVLAEAYSGGEELELDIHEVTWDDATRLEWAEVVRRAGILVKLAKELSADEEAAALWCELPKASKTKRLNQLFK